MHSIFWYIYVQPLNRIIFCMFLVVLLWAAGGKYLDSKKMWRMFNICCCVGAAIAILRFTLYNRTKGMNEIILIPFYSFVEAKTEPELYRSMLMNVFLFVPLGLSTPYVLPRKWGKYIKSIVTILYAVCLSVVIEGCQYRYGLGRCEVDDVIMNTMGAAIGTFNYILAKIEVRLKKQTNICSLSGVCENKK